MFARYLPSNYRVTLKLAVGVTQGHRKCHHCIAWVWFLIQLPYELWPYLARFPRYTDLLVKNRQIFLPPVFVTPVRGEAVLVKQRPLMMKNYNDGAIKW